MVETSSRRLSCNPEEMGAGVGGPLDVLTQLAASMFGVQAALVSIADSDRLLFKGKVGIADVVIGHQDSFSRHVMALGPGGVMMVEDASLDPRFADNPHVTGPAHVRFYAGTTITTADGCDVGAFCVLDQAPRHALDEREIATLKGFAATAASILDQQAVLRSKHIRLETLRLAEGMSGVGHWRLDVANGLMTWSDQLYRLHGLEPGAIEPDIDFFHPDDRETVKAAVEACVRTGEPYTLRVRLIRADGVRRQVEIRAVPETDEAGQVVSLFGVLHDITDQEALLNKARRNERRYRLLADNMGDVIARIRPDGSSNYISPAVEEFIGYTPIEMAGTLAQDYVLDSDKPLFMEAMSEVIRTGENCTAQYRVVHKNGEVRWLESNMRRLKTSSGDCEIVVVMRHVSERRALEEKLVEALEESRKNEQRYRLLAENMGDVITRVKADGTSKYISSAIQELLGWGYHEMSGQSLDYTYPEDRGIVLEAIQQAIRDGRQRTLQHRAVHKDGRVIWLESHFRAMSDEHRALGEAVVVMRDITDRKALEDELKAARDRAEGAAQAKSEFLANMSHELRTPLTSVVGFAGLLKQSDGLGSDERRYVDRIAAGSEALLAVINDILDYSKLEAGGVELDPHPFDLRDLAQGAVELMEAQCEAKGLSLTLEVEGHAPDVLVGDAGRLRQVLLNFLSNAVKFTADGGVQVKIGAGPQTDGRVNLEVAVTDSGLGVSDEMVEQLFERFTQADASTTRNFGGTGLGLAISRQLIEKMGGEIGASGTPGEGSTFWFRVPLTVGEAGAKEARGSGDLATTGRVLMADDAPANRELVSVILGHMGLEVETVENGEAAVAAVRSGHFDLVLMDVHMPVMDGLSAARAIRALGGEAGRTPIIALTANVGLDQVQACLESGMNGHLAKPINVGQLAQTLAGWLSPGEAAMTA